MPWPMVDSWSAKMNLGSCHGLKALHVVGLMAVLVQIMQPWAAASSSLCGSQLSVRTGAPNKINIVGSALLVSLLCMEHHLFAPCRCVSLLIFNGSGPDVHETGGKVDQLGLVIKYLQTRITLR